MKLIFKILILQLLAIVVTFGQSEFKCGTDEVLKGNPELQKILENIEKDYQQKKQNQLNVTPDMTTVYTIPVVFHVYHLGEAVGSGSNVYDAAIQASVNRLNAVFRATGIHSGLTPDIKIQFVLASYDPNCQPSNGIVRVDGRSISGYANGVPFADYTMQQALRNLSTWDINQYVNIRICHTITGTGGFAFYLNDLFMPANSVNTYTNYPGLDNFWAHEMGHSMNLYHTFYGDGTPNGGGTGTISVCPVNNDPENDGDKVSDTDPHKNDDGCNYTAINSCTGNPFGDILKNIMSYSCKEKFTPKQMERMRFALINYRSSLITSKGISGRTSPPICNSVTRCSSGSVTLTASGCSGTYNWYTSSSGGGSLGNGSTFNTPSISNSTTYYVSCTESNCGESIRTSAQAIISSILSIGCYCPSSAEQIDDEEIINVSVGNLFNSSTCSTTGQPGSVLNRYSDYTNLSPVNFIAGTYVNYSIGIGTCGGNYYSAIKIFIDFNQNGSFEDLGETVVVSSPTNGPHTVSGSFIMPSSASVGITFMRVVNIETGSSSVINSCSSYGWGETEDYKINIIGCTPPSAPTTTSASRCGAGAVILTSSGCSGTYDWYTATSGGVSLASTAAYTIPPISNTTNYYVSCTVGSCTSTRTLATATIKAIPSAPTVSSATINSGQTAVLNASNCSGSIIWYNATTGGTQLGTGISLTTTALTSTKIYYASCTLNGCVSLARGSGTVTVNQGVCPNQPDLYISGIDITKFTSSKINYTVSIKNKGTINANLGSVFLGVRTSSDNLRNANDVFKSQISIGGNLAPNGTLNFGYTSSFSFVDNQYYLITTIDDLGLLSECVETNNNFIKLVNQCSSASALTLTGTLTGKFYASNNAVNISNATFNGYTLVVGKSIIGLPNSISRNTEFIVGNCLTPTTLSVLEIQQAQEKEDTRQIESLNFIPELSQIKLNLLKPLSLNIDIWDVENKVFMSEVNNFVYPLGIQDISINTTKWQRGKIYIVQIRHEGDIEAIAVEW